MRNPHLRRWGGGLAAIVLIAGLGACSEGEPNPLPSVRPSAYQSADASPAASATDEPDPPEIQNDLRKRPLKRSINAGPVTLTAKYDTHLSLKKWRSNVSKPLHVSITAINKDKKNQKIYLTKVTVNVTAYDSAGPVDAPKALTDTTDINPGFIITRPNTYNQNFSLPAIDDAALYLTADLTYEMVLQVNKDKDGRNFSKQVAVDSMTIPIAR